MKKKLFGILSLLCITTLSIIALSGCGKEQANKENKNKVIKVGVMGEKNEVWDYLKQKLAKDNINIELVSFTDYSQPNEALNSGDIDINAFQHKAFLDNFNKEKGANLVPIGDTFLSPIGAYSKKIKDINKIKEGSTVPIPDDVTNQSRALALLKTAGLIKLADKEGPYEVKDIKENPKNLVITPVDASQTARSLDDPKVDVAVVNNDYAVDSGLNPTKDSIFLEPINNDSKLYINIIAAKKERENDPILKKIVEAYQKDDVGEKIKEFSKGADIPAWKGINK